MLLLWAALWAGIANGQAASPQSPAPPRPSASQLAPGIDDFAEISPYLYRGGQPSQKGLEALKKMGFEIVINMRSGRNVNEHLAVEKLGMKYVALPWHCPFPKDEIFARFLKLLQDNPRKKVFVHCRLGDDRTGMAIAAYRMAEEGWSAEEAMKEMEAGGFTGVHHVICPGLSEYEKSFPERLKKNPAFKGVRTQTEDQK